MDFNSRIVAQEVKVTEAIAKVSARCARGHFLRAIEFEFYSNSKEIYHKIKEKNGFRTLKTYPTIQPTIWYNDANGISKIFENMRTLANRQIYRYQL